MVETGNSEAPAVDSGSNAEPESPKRNGRKYVRRVGKSATSSDNNGSTSGPAESTASVGDGYSINPRTGQPFRLTDAERERERERAKRRHQQRGGGSIPTAGGITAEVHPSARVGRPRKSPVIEFLEEGPAAQLAEGYVATLNFTAGVLVGSDAVMNPMESAMVQTPLKNLIQRTPVGVLERSRGWLDPVTLIVALILWGRRVSTMVRQTPKVRAAAQVTDTAAPDTVAPPASTVHNGVVQDGPVIGAVPVPDVIRQHHLGDQGVS